jgi:hypothetical protein
MNPHQMHALADLHRGELARTAAVPTRRAARRPLGHRLGILLVEAGFHLLARAEQGATVRLSSPLAR